jgi:(4S)-4-hydroxy-5-phosphonooxypentane-2,3-dione isomerase
MHILLVYIHVKPEALDAFLPATLDNATNSLQEAGVVRFDLIQQAEDPTRFTLVEVYRSPEDHARHRETAHYLRWRSAVEEMMAEPRRGIQYRAVFPDDAGWVK